MDKEIDLFNNYYNNFDKSNIIIKSKYNHTFRVVSYAESIAKSLNLNPEDITLSKICALFHDIGRFNEVKKFNNLEDSNSFDHGDEGYNVLKKLNYNNDIVLLSTKYHNKYMVPNNINERTKMFCNIVRDADKLDILTYQYSNIEPNETISKDVLGFIKNKELVDNKKITNSTEAMLRGISFIFDINYNETFKILEKDKIIERKLSILLDNNSSEELKNIKDDINNYIEKRLLEC